MNEHKPMSKARWGLIGFGVGGLLIGASAFLLGLIAIGILVVPFIVWLAWNVLDFAVAIGAPELGFWGIILLTLFLTTGLGGRIVITLIVWLVDPDWLAGSVELQWPQPSFRTFVALLLLLMVAQIPAHTHHDHGSKERKAKRQATHEPSTPGHATPV